MPNPPYICASCLSFAFETCGSLCPVCRTAIENPQEFIEPAPFVLRTILSELDFQCLTCTHTIKLHQLPQHQESCIPNPVTTPIQNENPVQGAVSVTSPPPSPVTVSTVYYRKQYPLPAVSRLASRGEQWLHVCNTYTDRSQERLEKKSS